MQLGIFVFDFSWLEVAASLSVLQWMGIVLALGGWLLLAKPLLFVFFHLYEDLKVDLNVHHWKNVLLAIDIPALNVQTPKAVEQMFSQLAGAFHEPDLKDRLKDGYKQGTFGRYSSGEKMRISVASILALQKLINLNSKSGGLNLLIMDECLDSLDSKGLESIVQSLQKIVLTAELITFANHNIKGISIITIVKENGISTHSETIE
jgi:ABC-type multidrug transport system ATPase subunit